MLEIREENGKHVFYSDNVDIATLEKDSNGYIVKSILGDDMYLSKQREQLQNRWLI